MNKQITFDFNTKLSKAARILFGSRLVYLADHLKTVKASSREYNHSTFGANIQLVNGTLCGTSACALGDAVLSGKFPDLLLEFVSDTPLRTDGEYYLATQKHGMFATSAIAKEADAYFGPDAYYNIFSPSAFDIELGCKNPSKTIVMTRLHRYAKEAFGYTPP